MLARLLKAALLIVVGLSAAAVSLELGLRLLQSRGAALEGSAASCPAVGPETPLNHGPNAGRAQQRLGSPEVYGRFAGFQYEEDYDEHGIKRSTLRPQDGHGVRVLFMGDSFIEGYDDATTIPQHAYGWIVTQGALREPLIVLNAAYSSYSPVIFTAQAKQLLPVLRPDYVVIDIDETDFYDDAVRYRELVERDAGGRLVRVGRNRLLLDLAVDCERALTSPWLLWRMLGPLYYQRRIAAREEAVHLAERLFDVANSPPDDLPENLRAQAEYFSTTLDELFTTLKAYVPADRILVIRHPHLRHLVVNDGGGNAWNRVVGNLVAARAARNGVTFFDAQDELAAQFDGRPQRYYWSGDMHFNFDGMRAYGHLVGRELLRKLQLTPGSTGGPPTQ